MFPYLCWIIKEKIIECNETLSAIQNLNLGLMLWLQVLISQITVIKLSSDLEVQDLLVKISPGFYKCLDLPLISFTGFWYVNDYMQCDLHHNGCRLRQIQGPQPQHLPSQQCRPGAAPALTTTPERGRQAQEQREKLLSLKQNELNYSSYPGKKKGTQQPIKCNQE